MSNSSSINRRIKRLANKIVGDNFYIEESIGLSSTGITIQDLMSIDPSQSPFVLLELLQQEFDKKVDRDAYEADLLLVVDSSGNIFVGMSK